MFASVFAL